MNFLKLIANRIERGESLHKALNKVAVQDLRLHPIRPAYEDLRFPATAINPPGQASDPDFDTAKNGWLFSPSGTETLYMIAQMPHAWKEGTTLAAHVHWEKTTSAAGSAVWELVYSWSAYYEARTGDTTLTASTPVADTDTLDTQMITAFSDISATGRQISDMLCMKLSRLGSDGGDDYGADARLLEFDIHYQIDSFGSSQEYSK